MWVQENDPIRIMPNQVQGLPAIASNSANKEFDFHQIEQMILVLSLNTTLSKPIRNEHQGRVLACF